MKQQGYEEHFYLKNRMSKNEKKFSFVYNIIEFFLWPTKKITNDKFTFVSAFKYL